MIGPLSDKTGRRKPLLIGSVVCFIATALCGFSPNIEVFIAARFLMGFSGVELAGNRRQRSQVHVDTQRSDSSQRGKGDDNGGRNTEGNFNVIRVLMTLLRGSL